MSGEKYDFSLLFYAYVWMAHFLWGVGKFFSFCFAKITAAYEWHIYRMEFRNVKWLRLMSWNWISWHRYVLNGFKYSTSGWHKVVEFSNHFCSRLSYLRDVYWLKFVPFKVGEWWPTVSSSRTVSSTKWGIHSRSNRGELFASRKCPH